MTDLEIALQKGGKIITPTNANMAGNDNETDLQKALRAGGKVVSASTDPSQWQLPNKGFTRRTKEEIEASEPEMSVSGFVDNLSKGIKETAIGIGEIVTHPIETIKGVATLAKGAVELPLSRAGAISPTAGTQAWDIILEKGYEAIKHPIKTTYEKPIDVAMLGSGVLGIAGEATGIQKLSKIATMTDPVNLAIKGISLPIKGTSFATKHFVGILTGKGTPAVTEWMKGSADFYKGLRGTVSETDVVNNVRGSLSDIRTKRSNQYGATLKNIGLDNGGMQLGYGSVDTSLQSALKRYELPSGKLSLMPDDEVVLGKITEIIDDFKANTKGEPIDLHALKQKINYYYKGDRNSRMDTVISGVTKDINNLLESKVAGYKKMNEEYAKITNLSNEMEKSLVGGKKATIDASLKKLMASMRESPELRRDLMEQMRGLTNTDIQAQISGIMAKDFVPGNYIGRVMDVGLLFGAFNKVIDLSTASALFLSSPRVMGETLGALGWTKNQIQPMIDLSKKLQSVNPMLIRDALYFAGKKQAEEQVMNKQNSTPSESVMQNPTETPESTIAPQTTPDNIPTYNPETGEFE